MWVSQPSSTAYAGVVFRPLRYAKMTIVGATRRPRDRFFLEGGGILIDSPGMRELQLWGNEEGVERAFDDIATLRRALPVSRL